MVRTLSAGAVGVRFSGLGEAARGAKAFGFPGLEFDPKQVMELGAGAANDLFREVGVTPQVFGLPVEWRKDDATWQSGLDELPALADAAQAVGCTRCATWVLPCSNEREMGENVTFHVERFKPIAQILGDRGISLGLEFIGPKTLRDSMKYPFIHTMSGMLELGEKIGPNVGLLLDCWHWYTAHGTVDEIRALRPEQVVYVHVNDAPEGIPVDEQVDNNRRLPGQTGVIEIAGFLRALDAIGYRGPVAAEPFYPPLNELATNEDRLRTVQQSLDRIFDQACVPTQG